MDVHTYFYHSSLSSFHIKLATTLQELVEAAQQQPKEEKKAKRESPEELQEGSQVKCTVELVKNDAQCVVVRVHRAQGPLTIGFVSTCDHNVQHGNVKRSFKRGQDISATVAKLQVASDTQESVARLVLTTSLQPQAGGRGSRNAREEFYTGKVVTGVVETVKPQHVEVKLSSNVTGYLSACDIADLKTAKVPSCLVCCCNLTVAPLDQFTFQYFIV